MVLAITSVGTYVCMHVCMYVCIQWIHVARQLLIKGGFDFGLSLVWFGDSPILGSFYFKCSDSSFAPSIHIYSSGTDVCV
jgi:hypothetical protein